MKERTGEAIFIIINVIGVILILMSAFDIIPRLDNILVFCGLFFFMISLTIRKLTK